MKIYTNELSHITKLPRVFKTCFSEKQLGDLEPKFIRKLEGEWE